MNGGFVSPESYEFYKAEGYLDDKIPVIKYVDLIRIQEEEWAKEKSEIEIKNSTELIKYIYKNLLDKSQKEKVKMVVKKYGKDYNKIIEALPPTYKQMVFLRKAYDSRKTEQKEKIAENIARTIGLTEEDKKILEKPENEIFTDMDEFLQNNPFIEE